MLGIALGSFMEGFEKGARLGTQFDELRQARKLRAGIEGVQEQGKADFAAGVKSGEFQAGDWDNFYDQHVLPLISNEYKAAGDIDKAAKWDEFADTKAARNGSKYFASGLQKLQLGDTQGGLDDMIKSANTQGYGPDGKLTAAELYDEGAGAVTGYKLTFTRPDGTAYTKNVAKDDLPNFFAATVNPKAAFETKQASDAAQAKEQRELETFTKKELVKKQLGTGEGGFTQKDYVKAVQDERKRIEDNALTNQEYADMSDDEKEALARKTVDERLGRTSAAPAEPQVYVDPDTGEQVAPTQAAPAPEAAAPTQAAPVVAPAPAATTAADQQTAPAEQAAPAPANAAPAPNGIVQPTTAAAPTTDRQAAIAKAAQLMQQGGDPQTIAAALRGAGIPQDQWPQEVVLAMPGLGQ